MAYLREATALVASLPGPVERQVYAIRVAGEAGVGQEAVIQEVERRRKQLLSRARKTEEQNMNRPERIAQPAEMELRYHDPISAAAEEGVVRLLYLEPALASEPGLPDAKAFSSEALRDIYSILLDRIRKGEAVSVASLAGSLTPEEMSLLVRLLQKPEQLSNGRKALQDYVAKIREQNEADPSSDLNALRDRLRERKGYHS